MGPLLVSASKLGAIEPRRRLLDIACCQSLRTPLASTDGGFCTHGAERCSVAIMCEGTVSTLVVSLVVVLELGTGERC
jgi:hypothetical protein